MYILYFWLLIEIKHFLFDYYLQPTWMYEGKRDVDFWFPVLLLHAAIVATPSLLILWWLTGEMIYGSMAFFTDFVQHAAIDRSKLYVEKYLSPGFAMVVDQLLHQATYLLIYYWILK